jgi:hypothetical protein
LSFGLKHQAAFSAFMDDSHELAKACHLCRQNGFEHAAFILGREWGNEIRAKRKPRRKMVQVRLQNGGPAWIERGRLGEATERDD